MGKLEHIAKPLEVNTGACRYQGLPMDIPGHVTGLPKDIPGIVSCIYKLL